MTRIVLATFGSLGSLHPCLAVARGLQARGHDVCVAAGESYRDLIEANALDFHAVRPDRVTIDEDRAARKASTEMKSASGFAVKNLLRYVRQTYDDLLDACRHADLFVSHPAAFSAPLVAEKLGIPWLSVALAPATLFSASDPPVLPALPWLAHVPRLGGFPHSLIFRAFKKATRGWMQPIDALRREVGLPATPRHPFFEGMFSPYGTLGWFSRLLASPQPDWPAHTKITGFPFYVAQPGETDAALEKFLHSGEPPVIFTLGSNVVREPGSFYQESYRAVRQVGCRAVFLAGDNPVARDGGEAPDQIFVTRYAPYDQLFHRAAAVVHQGGIGTTGQAMAAGLPMLIVPHVHDQPDNAFRARKLGVARQESRDGYRAASAAKHLQALLKEPGYRESALRVREQMQAEDGVGAACGAMERVLRAPVVAAAAEREAARA